MIGEKRFPNLFFVDPRIFVQLFFSGFILTKGQKILNKYLQTIALIDKLRLKIKLIWQKQEKYFLLHIQGCHPPKHKIMLQIMPIVAKK